MEFPAGGSIEEVRNAIEAGADVMALDAKGNSPLHFVASHNTDPEVINALVGEGADVNAKNESGCTPLHVAAAFNANPSIVKALLEHGADRSARTDIGDTPYDYAVNQQDLDSETNREFRRLLHI